MNNLREAAEAAFTLLQKRYSGDKEDFVVMAALATALMEPVQQAEPVMLNGLTEAETNAAASVTGLTKQAEPVAWPMEEQPDGTVIPADQAEVAPPQQQAEPVAWMDREGDLYKMPEIKNWAPPHTMLYTATPQRKPLTDEEIYECERIAAMGYQKHAAAIRGQQFTAADDPQWHFARAIEAAHGIGEKHE